MHAYDTVTDALIDLKKRGFTTDFNVSSNKIECSKTGGALNPSEFEIVEHYRFEGETNPGDEEVVYAIAAKDGSMKGVLVNAFGTYDDPVTDELVRKLEINE